MTAPLLEVRDLQKHFAARGGTTVRAVDGVSFDIAPGETLGLVGESGCGKTTLGRLILRLEDATGGTIRFAGQDLLALRGGALRRARRQLQVVFQDPYGSLDPRMTVRRILAEPFAIHGEATDDARLAALLDAVGLTRAHLDRYPHEFSGGQRQRIGIARALALEPRLVVLDEPVSALDVSVQAQVLNLLAELQGRLGLSFLFIAHGLAAVRFLSHRVAVMYLGQIVEVAPAALLFARPLHPYTEALLSAAPIPDPAARRQRTLMQGDPPSPVDPPPGCRFHTRCRMAAQVGERCRTEAPALRASGEGRLVACHLHAPSGGGD